MDDSAVESIADDRIRNEYVVDADFHLNVTSELLLEYIDDDRIREKVEDFGFPSIHNAAWTGVTSTYAYGSGHTSDFYGSALTTEEIVDVKDSYGIDSVITTPLNELPVFMSNYPKVSTAIAKAYNEYLLEEVVDVDEGIFGTLAISVGEPEEAAKEIDRVGSNEGVVGVHGFVSPELWGDIRYDPIFEMCTKHDLPLAPHLGAFTVNHQIDHALRTYMSTIVTGVGANVIANVTNMIGSGVFDRFPDLRVVWVETGAQWIPYVANRMDEISQGGSKDVQLTPRQFEDEREYLERKPSEYIFENMFITTQPTALPKRADQLEATLTTCHAEDMFIYSSDWPHVTLDPPKWVFDSSVVDDDLRECILHRNAQRAYRLPSEE